MEVCGIAALQPGEHGAMGAWPRGGTKASMRALVALANHASADRSRLEISHHGLSMLRIHGDRPSLLAVFTAHGAEQQLQIRKPLRPAPRTLKPPIPAGPG